MRERGVTLICVLLLLLIVLVYYFSRTGPPPLTTMAAMTQPPTAYGHLRSASQFGCQRPQQSERESLTFRLRLRASGC